MFVRRNLQPLRRRRALWAAGALVVLAGLIAGAGLVALSVFPGLGAQGSDLLREVIGDQAVAALETGAFQAQDTLRQWAFRLKGSQASAPWDAGVANTPTSQGTAGASVSVGLSRIPGLGGHRGSSLALSPAWTMPALTPLGTTPGEGQWAAYLHAPTGQVVASRTFLHPDAGRPYTVAAIVAFDLSATRLNFVLGSEEPASPVPAERSGRIAAGDLHSGLLLAAFNGGFKARHGHFGAMADKVVVIPPRPGLATVAIYADGSVRLGAWGTDIQASPDLVSWRQNGPLIIEGGQVSPHTADSAPQDWGYVLNGATATYRSALGLSPDGRTLYYVAGPSLTLPALARALADIGVANAMQLDINDYWVHFDAFQMGASGPQPLPLLQEMKGQGDHRYLAGYTRDFFYVTAVPR